MKKMEQHWMDFITLQGCSIRSGQCVGPLHRHHLTHGGRRKCHFRSIPLCAGHHHWDSPLQLGQAYHKGTKAWERNHGSVEDFLERLREKYFNEFQIKPWENEDATISTF